MNSSPMSQEVGDCSDACRNLRTCVWQAGVSARERFVDIKYLSMATIAAFMDARLGADVMHMGVLLSLRLQASWHHCSRHDDSKRKANNHRP